MGSKEATRRPVLKLRFMKLGRSIITTPTKEGPGSGSFHVCLDEGVFVPLQDIQGACLRCVFLALHRVVLCC